MSSIVFATLGPSGTCHELATRSYIEFQQIPNAQVELISDFLEALELLRNGKFDFIVQNSAHPEVYQLIEKYFREVFVIDSFLFPTKEMAVLKRRDVERPRCLGLMPSTRAYVDTSRWETTVYEPSNPIVARHLLMGKYDSGITFKHYAEEHKDLLVVDEVIGFIYTPWLVYGRQRRSENGVIGIRNPALFLKEPVVT